MELVSPAGNLPSLKAAVDNGADAVYIGFRDATNARHFAGLNFDDRRIAQGIRYAHDRGVKLFVAINTYPQPAGWSRWCDAVDRAAGQGVDALIMADAGLMDYARTNWPDARLHLSVQASATNEEAIRFYHERFAIRRVVLPRVLSLKQLLQVAKKSPVDVEVFGFGSLCVMVEGRCLLSSYVTGRSPNTSGVCSPADSVSWNDTANGLETRLNNMLIDRYAADEPAGYPTLCKGRFNACGNTYYAIEEPVSLNTLELLPELLSCGVRAIKIEGRQRSPAYVAEVVRVWRDAIDACLRTRDGFEVKPSWLATLRKVSEGSQTTYGAYHRPWQ